MNESWGRVLRIALIVLAALALMGQSRCPTDLSDDTEDSEAPDIEGPSAMAKTLYFRFGVATEDLDLDMSMVRALTMVDENTGFVAGDDGYLGQTDDGFETAQDISPGFAIDLTDADSDGDRVMVTGTMGTVLDTMDRGGTWGLGMPPDINDLPNMNTIDVFGNRAIVGGAMGVVWLVADTVMTEAVTGFDPDVLMVTASPDGETLVALVMGGTVIASSDAGLSWFELTETWMTDTWFIEGYDDSLWLGGYDGDEWVQGHILWSDIAADVELQEDEVLDQLLGEGLPPVMTDLAGVAVAGAEGYDDPIVYLGGSTADGGLIMWVHGDGTFSFHETDDPVLALDVVETAGGAPRIFAITPGGALVGDVSEEE